jgi:hypothetical protein
MTSPVTVEPAESAAEERVFADALALTVTVSTATSPPKMLTVEISGDALALSDGLFVATAPEVAVAVLITEPSLG